VLVDGGPGGALQAARRLRGAIQAHDRPGIQPGLGVTVGAGVVTV